MAAPHDEIPMTDDTVPRSPRETTIDQLSNLLREANSERRDQGKEFVRATERQGDKFAKAIDMQSERFAELITRQGQEMRASISSLTWRFIVAIVLVTLATNGIPFAVEFAGVKLDTKQEKTPVSSVEPGSSVGSAD